MFIPKYALAGIASAVILAFSASDAKAQYVQYGYGSTYVNPYAGNVYRGSSYYSPYGVYQSGYSNNVYNRGVYNRGGYNRSYYSQPYYGGRNYYNNGYNRNRGSGLFFNFGIRR